MMLWVTVPSGAVIVVSEVTQDETMRQKATIEASIIVFLIFLLGCGLMLFTHFLKPFFGYSWSVLLE